MTKRRTTNKGWCPQCDEQAVLVRAGNLRLCRPCQTKRVALRQLMMTAQASPPQPSLHPTRDTWVARDREGHLRAVRVTDMEPTHLFRWIQMFREKVRKTSGFGSNDEVDAVIMKTMVTAPAIYHRAVVLGLIARPGGDGGKMIPPTTHGASTPALVPRAGRSRWMDFDREDE